MNVTPEVLAELRRKHLNATAAPWVVEEHMDGILTVETSNEALWKRLDLLQISIRGKERLRGENNGKFIALVRNNIGALLDEVERLRAENERLHENYRLLCFALCAKLDIKPDEIIADSGEEAWMLAGYEEANRQRALEQR